MVRLVAGTADSDIAPQLRRPGHRLRLGHRRRGRGDRVPDRQHAGAGYRERHRAGHGLAAEPGRLPAHVAADDGDRGRRGATGRECRRARTAGCCGSARPATRAGGPTLDGQPLAPVDDGWQQAFALPASGGTLTWSSCARPGLAAARPGRGAAGGGGARRPRRTPSRGPGSDQVRPAGRHPGGAGRDGRPAHPRRGTGHRAGSSRWAPYWSACCWSASAAPWSTRPGARAPAVPDPAGRPDHDHLHRHPAGRGVPPTTDVAAVVSRQAPGREGRLTGTPLGAEQASLTITEQGKGEAAEPADTARW